MAGCTTEGPTPTMYIFASAVTRVFFFSLSLSKVSRHGMECNFTGNENIFRRQKVILLRIKLIRLRKRCLHATLGCLHKSRVTPSVPKVTYHALSEVSMSISSV